MCILINLTYWFVWLICMVDHSWPSLVQLNWIYMTCVIDHPLLQLWICMYWGALGKLVICMWILQFFACDYYLSAWLRVLCLPGDLELLCYHCLCDIILLLYVLMITWWFVCEFCTKYLPMWSVFVCVTDKNLWLLCDFELLCYYCLCGIILLL